MPRPSRRDADRPPSQSAAPGPGRQDPGILRVRVKPNARESRLSQGDDGSWTATLKAPPVDGKANAELILLIARHFDVPRAAVEIRTGAGARLKLVKVRRE